MIYDARQIPTNSGRLRWGVPRAMRSATVGMPNGRVPPFVSPPAEPEVHQIDADRNREQSKEQVDRRGVKGTDAPYQGGAGTLLIRSRLSTQTRIQWLREVETIRYAPRPAARFML